jgi:hypothetical protein
MDPALTPRRVRSVSTVPARPRPLLAAELAVLALGDIASAGGLGIGDVTVVYERADPSRLPPHLERQAKQLAAGFPPALPNWPGARDGWARD